MDSSFKTNQLSLPKINYELRIKDTFTEKPMSDKRKILDFQLKGDNKVVMLEFFN